MLKTESLLQLALSSIRIRNLIMKQLCVEGVLNTDIVKQASLALKAHSVVALPTDTIYGLASLAQSSQAVADIYSIKGRDFSKALSICVADVSDVYNWGKVSIDANLLSQLLPGPVTLIFARTPQLNPDLNPGHKNVGIRIPNHDFIRSVARECSEPIALTSANRGGERSTVRVEEFSELWPNLALVCDGGCLGDSDESRLGSTVVDLSLAGSFIMVRPGCAYSKTRDTLVRGGLKELSQ